MNSALNNTFPHRIERIVSSAMEEILGQNQQNAIINLALLPKHIDQPPVHNQHLEFPFRLICHLQTALESAYGPRAGRGMALRVGRACLKYGLREFGTELGITDLSFRLLPLPTRIRVGSEALVKLFNQFTDQLIRLEMDEKHISWYIQYCLLCRDSQADVPCCALAVGLLQEALYWLSGGKNFLVEEEKCIACGDSTCTIVIDRTPMS